MQGEFSPMMLARDEIFAWHSSVAAMILLSPMSPDFACWIEFAGTPKSPFVLSLTIAALSGLNASYDSSAASYSMSSVLELGAATASGNAVTFSPWWIKLGVTPPSLITFRCAGKKLGRSGAAG